MADDPPRLTDLLDSLDSEVKDEQVALGTLLEASAGRSHGPLLLVPAALAVLPTGAIPGMSILIGALLVLVAAQIAFGSGSPWLPRRVREFELQSSRVRDSLQTARGPAERLDRILEPRLEWLASPPLHRVVALCCCALAASMLPLAAVPFAVAVPGLAVTAFGAGLALKDGLLVLAGYGASAVTGWILWTNLG